MLTSSFDLVVWPLVVWLVIRALLRVEPRWWLAAGAVVGLSVYNKWLIAALMISLVVGLLAVGPRSVFRSPWAWLAAALAVAIASPNVIYQWTNGWPQLAVGRGLSAENAAEVRVEMWPLLALMLGPPLVVVWVAGWWALARRAGWEQVRFLAVAFPVLLALTYLGGTQAYYPIGLLVVLFAAGWVPLAARFARARLVVRGVVIGLLVLNALVSAVISLPVLPVATLGRSPVPAVNPAAADQVGWPAYVDQIAAVYRSLPAGELPRTAVVVSNYGEAGAVARYGAARGLPPAYSGHNQLFYEARPPDDAKVIVLVGGQTDRVRSYFAECTVQWTLDNRLAVDNEEQGQQVATCRGPREAWPQLWERFRHVD